MRRLILILSIAANFSLAVHIYRHAGSSVGVSGGEASQNLNEAASPQPVQEESAPMISISVTALEAVPAEELVARLRAAALPDPLVRAIVTAMLAGPREARSREMQAHLLEIPYWRELPDTFVSPDQQRELNELDRAASARAFELLGPEIPTGLAVITNRARYGNMPLEAIARVQMIERDYAQLESRAQVEANLLRTPTPATAAVMVEQLILLGAEREKDLRAALTPEDYEDYSFRASPVASALWSNLRGFAPTEGEFRAMFALQDSFEKRYPRSSAGARLDPELARDRTEAQLRLIADMRATLMPDRHADFDLATKP